MNRRNQIAEVLPVQPRRRPGQYWMVWGFTLVATLLVVGLISLPPLLGPEMRAWIMAGFSPLCHQLPGRSPHIDGVQLAVCHRCYGIYWGLPLAVVAWLGVGGWERLLDRWARWVVAGSLVPLTIDWGGDVVGLWTNTPLSRLITGGLFGVVAGLFLIRAVMQACGLIRNA